MKITQYLIRKSRIQRLPGELKGFEILSREFLCHEEGSFETVWISEKESNPATLTIFSSEAKAKTWMKINEANDGPYRFYEVVPFEIKLDFKIPKKKEEPKLEVKVELPAPPPSLPPIPVPAFP